MNTFNPIAKPNLARRRFLQFASLCLLADVQLLAQADAVRAAPLKYRDFTVTRPGLNRDVPPGKESLEWVANSATLIYGEREAVLVDTFLTVSQNLELAQAIASTGRNLKGIVITHAHGDHFLGLHVLKTRFPLAEAWATREVAAGVALRSTPEQLDNRWRKLFPGEIADVVEAVKPLESNSIDLEGNALVIHRLGQTDTSDSTCLHVPSIGLVVAGDAVYDGIHPFLAESTRSSRREWLVALDRIAALHPKAVVAGHKNPAHGDDPSNIAATRRYIEDFIRLDARTTSERALYAGMLELYPDWANPGSLWSSAIAAKTKSASAKTNQD